MEQSINVWRLVVVLVVVVVVVVVVVEGERSPTISMNKKIWIEDDSG